MIFSALVIFFWYSSCLGLEHVFYSLIFILIQVFGWNVAAQNKKHSCTIMELYTFTNAGKLHAYP